MKQIDIEIIRNDEPLNATAMVHQRDVLSYQGQLFTELVKINCHVMGPVRIHKSGRQIFEPLSPKEIVDRAAMIAAMTWEVLEDNKWMGKMPSLESLKGVAKNKTGF